MEYIPLSEACLSEVLARVSFRYIHMVARRAIWFGSANELMNIIGNGLNANLPKSCLSAWVYAYAREWSPMNPTKFVRDAFIFRARQGYSWRNVVFPQYKRNRSDPRVTNRGVAREVYWKEKGQ